MIDMVGFCYSASGAGIGQKRSLAEAWWKVRLRIRKATFEPIAAAQNDLFDSYVGFAISKRK